MNPACRPMTSMMITRSWLSAVVWSLSIASIAVFTAVSNPKVLSVPLTSLSMVFGTHTTRIPFFASFSRDRQRSVAADRDERVDPEVAGVLEQLVGPVHLDEAPVGLPHRIGERIPAIRRAQDRAAEMPDAAHLVPRERNHLVVAEQPRVPPLDPEHVPAAIDRGEHGGTDDGVEPRRVAAAGGYRDPHASTRRRR